MINYFTKFLLFLLIYAKLAVHNKVIRFTYKNGLHDEGTKIEIIGRNGEYRVDEVKNGSYNGKVIDYFADGSVWFEGIYKDGKRVEGKRYDEEGNLIYEGEYDENGEPFENIIES